MAETKTTKSVLTVTSRAVEEITLMKQKPENRGKSMRVYVEQGGCSGMQYSLVFDEQRDGDLMAEAGGAMVLVDSFSAQYLRGSQVDFSDDLTSGGFKITNPNARESCGCGKSFNA